MTAIQVSPKYYVESCYGDTFENGGIFQGKPRTAGMHHWVGRFYVTRPPLEPEGYHDHQKLDCYFTTQKGFLNRPLISRPETLAIEISKALADIGVISEPFFLSWHWETPIGGKAFGEVFDND